MNKELSTFAARLRAALLSEGQGPRGFDFNEGNGDSCNSSLQNFNSLALELFALQFRQNHAYRKICEARRLPPEVVEHWTQIPTVPTSAFKELELSCIPPEERTAVFHSSGTTEQKPSRHFHCAESLEIYEASLWSWFEPCILGNLKSQIPNLKLLCLTPPPEQAPHSSLVHMFETVRRKLDAPDSAFVGQIGSDSAWTLDFDATLAALSLPHSAFNTPQLILGTAFSFVHLLDFLAEQNLRVELPAGARVMETGGYKNRSRSLPKAELHALITERLGVPAENILCEYGMSELSSQAHAGAPASSRRVSECAKTKLAGKMPALPDRFRFPPWARAQIISPETGREVAEGETGLIRVCDLANVFSVASVQTEDLGIRRGDGFELIGRAQLAEPRGCSLMTA